MLASLHVIDWDVARSQIRCLLKSSSIDVSEKNGIGALDHMHQVYQRLISPNPDKAVIGYSNFIFSDSRAYPWPSYH